MFTFLPPFSLDWLDFNRLLDYSLAITSIGLWIGAVIAMFLLINFMKGV